MSPHTDKPETVLRALARRQDWTEQDFAREYDLAAADLLGERAEPAPDLRTIRRWYWGDAKPRQYHRPVLERMFPGYEVRDLLRPFDRRRGAPVPPPRNTQEVQSDAPRQSTTRTVGGPAPQTEPQSVTGAQSDTTDMSARLRSMMSWIDQTSPIKEREIHRPGPAPEFRNTPAPRESARYETPTATPAFDRGFAFWGNLDRFGSPATGSSGQEHTAPHASTRRESEYFESGGRYWATDGHTIEEVRPRIEPQQCPGAPRTERGRSR